MIDLKRSHMARKKTEIDIERELRVKEILDERGIMMKDFADKIGITRETLTRSLKGNPQYSTLKAIADGLGLSVPELFKQQLKKDEVFGCLYMNGEPHIINSKEEALKLLGAKDFLK